MATIVAHYKSADLPFTSQKMKFFFKDFFSKCDQIRSFLWIWSHLLKKSLMGNFIFYAMFIMCFKYNFELRCSSLLLF